MYQISYSTENQNFDLWEKAQKWHLTPKNAIFPWSNPYDAGYRETYQLEGERKTTYLRPEKSQMGLLMPEKLKKFEETHPNFRLATAR